MLKKSKNFLFLGLFVLLFTISAGVAFAESTNEVVLLVEGQNNCEIADKQIAVQAEIVFSDSALINESLMLSYHIYGKDGELLLFEGNRTPLNAFIGNTIQGVPIALNLDEVEELNGQKYIVVEFDIVDEKNLYWFSKNEEVNFATARIIYDDSFLAKVKQVVREIASNPYLLILNFAIYGVCAFCIIKYKKSQ